MLSLNATRFQHRAFNSLTSGHFYRAYSSSGKAPSTAKLVAELRKRTEVSISKARDALAATNNDVEAALEWIHEDLASSGAKKAAKVADRATSQGVICTSVLSDGSPKLPGDGRPTGMLTAAMVELNCETDFVARNQLFCKLAADIAHSATFVDDGTKGLFRKLEPDFIRSAPLISSTANKAYLDSKPISVAEAIRDTIAKVGENISLRRVVTVGQSAVLHEEPSIGLRLASYTHGAANPEFPTQGRIGALAMLALQSPKLPEFLKKPEFLDELAVLERSIAKQIVGFPTLSVKKGEDDETVLYKQPFMMLRGEYSSLPVEQALRAWAASQSLISDPETSGVEVLEFFKWTVGDA
ncbi:Elongation factor Ts, mitochondrial [Pleurotus pulmonarius]|nr:Elongation factor Ts, mitochondrial [Pleurotus pulmonarius]